MILRSRALKFVHFLGLPQTHVRELESAGVVRVPLPSAPGVDVLRSALSFAFSGKLPGDASPVSDGQGYAYVEVGFRLPGDSHASLFRGVDRRGTAQVSLREEGGLKVTGGADDVDYRLRELLGDDLDAWRGAALPDPVPAESTDVRRAVLACIESAESEAPTTEYAGGTDPVSNADSDTGAGPGADDSAAEASVEALRRALRNERLGRLAARRHAELLEHGGRLRRERADTAHEVDRLGAARERVRTQLRRVNDYRDAVARGAAVETAPPEPATVRGGAAVEWGLATCASFLLLLLVIYSTGGSSDPDRHVVQVGLGLGFLLASASYLAVATRRHPGVGRFLIIPDNGFPVEPAPPPSSTEWREALRARFEDAEDLDDPATPTRLRERLTEHDALLSPQHARLERLDDAIVVHDVEAGRAARALHLPLPQPELAETGLPDDGDDPIAATLAAVKRLGDSVYSATVERDALLAGGSDDLDPARTAALRDIRTLGTASGRESEADLLAAQIASFDPGDGEDAPEDGLAETLRHGLVGLSVPSDAAEPVLPAPTDVTSAAAAAVPFDVSAATGGGIDALVRDGDGIIAVRGATREPWDALADADRAALAVAAAVSSAHAADPLAVGEGRVAPGFVALSAVPEGLDDDALFRAARAGRATVAQVLVAAAPAEGGGGIREPRPREDGGSEPPRARPRRRRPPRRR